MALTLTIENFTKLPDRGPLAITVPHGRGIDIGRETYLDWTLPNPNMYISSKHCEAPTRDGANWPHDVSLNGTFLDSAASRLQEPLRVCHRDPPRPRPIVCLVCPST
jgi:type VI secretion system protein ImpI